MALKKKKSQPSGKTRIALRESQRLIRNGNPAEAIETLEVALKSNPDNTDLLFALALAAREVGHTDAAKAFYQKVLLQEPGQIESTTNLANIHRSAGDYDAAIDALKAAISLHPTAHQLWLTLAHSVRESGDNDNAETFYEEALRIKPRYAEALAGLGDLFTERRESKLALEYYDRALRLSPQDPQLHVNKAIWLLNEGDLLQGWREYEWRLKLPAKRITRSHKFSRWQGSSLEEKTLLIMAEQGIGDQIMFASCFGDLLTQYADTSTKIIAECEERLIPDFQRSFPSITFYPQNVSSDHRGIKMDYENILSEHKIDCAIELASLPSILRKETKDFPLENAFIKANSEEANNWKSELNFNIGLPSIGICWRSGIRGGLRDLQIAPLEEWGTFLSNTPANFINLQYDSDPDELQELERVSGKTILNPQNIDQKNEIERVFSLCSVLDYVVSAPTAVASIAGACGTPTFKVLYHDSWTAFGQDRDLFLPSCKIIRPDKTGNWQGSFNRIADDLQGNL